MFFTLNIKFDGLGRAWSPREQDSSGAERPVKRQNEACDAKNEKQTKQGRRGIKISINIFEEGGDHYGMRQLDQMARISYLGVNSVHLSRYHSSTGVNGVSASK